MRRKTAEVSRRFAKIGLMSIENRIERYLAEIEAKNLTRKLVSPHGIDLSSNDFLGLARDARLKKAFIEGVETLGAGSTGSRLLRGEREIFAAAENAFAVWKKAEKSLYFSSGYQANVGLFQTFCEESDAVFSDELNHASIIDGLRLAKAKKVIFPHRDFDKISRLLRETAARGEKFLVTESLFSMDGTIAPLDKYAEICAETKTNLIVDEAHAVGVFGKTGSGLIEHFGIGENVFLSLNTAGKALGVSGAFAAGKRLTIEFLIQKCRAFIFSTAPPPSSVFALKKSIEIIQSEPARREKLLKLSGFLRKLLKEKGFAVSLENSQIIPILIGESGKAVEIAEKLQREGFDVRAIRPPTVAEGKSRLRVSLNTNLTEEILREFVALLVKYLK